MGHYLLKKSNAKTRLGQEPGTWRLALRSCGLVYVQIKCPECARNSSMRVNKDTGHTVDGCGNVSPSLVCPHSGCSWHVFGKLDGWRS